MCKVLYGLISTITLLLVISNGKSDSLDDILSEQWKLVTLTYLRYDATKDFLDLMKQSFPENLDYYSIGKSVQGRELYVARMGNNMQKPEKERPLLNPKIRMIGNIHGDDTLGKQLLLMFIIDVLKQHKVNDERANRILDQTEIHLLLTMNPDGYEVAKEGECSPDENILGRLNANLVDLAGSFPDIRIQDGIYENRQPETLSVINWIDTPDFLLSITFFAGEIFAAYPYFTVDILLEEDPNYTGRGAERTVYGYNDVAVHLASTYAKNHKKMGQLQCNQTEQFENGIINGAKWHNMPANLHDWSFVQRCMDILVGVSCCKSVPASTFAEEWENNKESIYRHIENAHMGFKGVVLRDEKPVEDIYVEIYAGADRRTNERGEYWILQLPGEYEVYDDFHGVNKSVRIKVESHDPPRATVYNFTSFS